LNDVTSALRSSTFRERVVFACDAALLWSAGRAAHATSETRRTAARASFAVGEKLLASARELGRARAAVPSIELYARAWVAYVEAWASLRTDDAAVRERLDVSRAFEVLEAAWHGPSQPPFAVAPPPGYLEAKRVLLLDPSARNALGFFEKLRAVARVERTVTWLRNQVHVKTPAGVALARARRLFAVLVVLGSFGAATAYFLDTPLPRSPTTEPPGWP
jgi:nucleotide-binding universal stress UspA family protein